jgi:hypothetical protein
MYSLNKLFITIMNAETTKIMNKLMNLKNNSTLGSLITKDYIKLLNSIVEDVLLNIKKDGLNMRNNLNIIFLSSGEAISEIYIVLMLNQIGFKLGNVYLHDYMASMKNSSIRLLDSLVTNGIIKKWIHVRSFKSLNTAVKNTNITNTFIIGIQYQYAIFAKPSITATEMVKHFKNIKIKNKKSLIELKATLGNKKAHIYHAQEINDNNWVFLEEGNNVSFNTKNNWILPNIREYNNHMFIEKQRVNINQLM